MAALEDLKAGASIRGLVPDGLAKVVQVEWFGNQAVKITFEDASGGRLPFVVITGQPGATIGP